MSRCRRGRDVISSNRRFSPFGYVSPDVFIDSNFQFEGMFASHMTKNLAWLTHTFLFGASPTPNPPTPTLPHPTPRSDFYPFLLFRFCFIKIFSQKILPTCLTQPVRWHRRRRNYDPLRREARATGCQRIFARTLQ